MTPSDASSFNLEKIRATSLNEGFIPRSWEEVLVQAHSLLPVEKLQDFERYHRNFIAYPTEATLKRFYGFCYRENLADLLAEFRFHRITRLMAWLETRLPDAKSLLDFGAGTGKIMRWVHKQYPWFRIAGMDWVPEAQVHWGIQNPHPVAGETFDRVLCFDSLGEIHSDEDDAISQFSGEDLSALGEMIEQRYGFAGKLEQLRTYFHLKTRLWISEPIPHPHFWNALAFGLQKYGWKTELFLLPQGLVHKIPEPNGYLLQITQAPPSG